MELSVLLSMFYVFLVKATHAAIFSDKWAVNIIGGEQVAKDLARKHGFIYLAPIMPDYYHFQHRKVAKRSITSSSHRHHSLRRQSEVLWLEQQVIKRRVKRDYSSVIPYSNVVENLIPPNDPQWRKQWYLHRGGNLDIRVKGAWEMGYTGKNVVVTILDDGIEKDHPDLAINYDARASYDVNNHDNNPMPRYDEKNENKHGTRCAGEVAAAANNSVCIVGVAYDAFIGGVRMLDGDVTDAVEAMSLSYNPQHIDIYSASWGPDDDGKTADGPARLARKAFLNGITNGRGGLGSVFVWASGNGGRQRDNCNCDGYTNSIYTLSISSVTEKGNVPWYSEACSSTLATTYSSGSSDERQIVTTDLHKSCTTQHTGTSASAPLAAGIVALTLQANSRLSWRDLQHIVVRTANPTYLTSDDWVVNGVGRKVSHSFGYGLMDATAMVQQALNWTNVPSQQRCEVPAISARSKIRPFDFIRVTIDTNGCDGMHNHVQYLEHVMAKISLTAAYDMMYNIDIT
ncbi:PREDICTED: furin-like [Priapulus caudatus]|uniref:Furin-like n=1 Tax=Priapulus caudatus TaxID=37621 RepID=A0ABM1E3P5_PRICU|nr:PREDICTED: furin-like [Priapulus caudatus]